jgi:hypothetical protein
MVMIDWRCKNLYTDGVYELNPFLSNASWEVYQGLLMIIQPCLVLFCLATSFSTLDP